MRIKGAGKSLTRWVWYALGTLLLFVPLLPIAQWVGARDTGPAWRDYASSSAIGVAVVLIVALLCGRLSIRFRAPNWPGFYGVKVVLFLAVALTIAAAVVASAVFARSPQLVDEMAQLFHAKIFAAGRIAAPVPEPAEFFLLTHTFLSDAGWISQYPPGQSLLLAVGYLLDLEWLVNPLLGGLSTILIYFVARGLYGIKTATVAALLWASAAWVVFMSATYMNHVSAVAFSLLAWAALFAPKLPRRRHFLLAGFALSVVAVTRPLDAIGAAVPVMAWVGMHRHWRKLGFMVIGGLPLIVAFGVLNSVTLGHPLALGYTTMWGSAHGIGFHTDPYGHPFTPLIALGNLSAAVRRLHIYFYEWPIPALLPLGLWAFASRHGRRSDLIVGLGVVTTPLLYFFYWHSGFHPGPRFYYAMAPWGVIGTELAWRWLWVRARLKSSHLLRWDVAAAALAAVVLVWGAVGVFPVRFAFYRDSLPRLKLHPEKTLEQQAVSQALVLVPVSWGSRTISKLWSLGAPYSLVENAYRTLDACQLHEFAENEIRSTQSRQEITVALEVLVRENPVAAPQVPGAPDPTLKLWPDQPLSEECALELRRDFEGFTVYPTLGWRNEINLAEGIVWARDRFEQNVELLERYSGWPVWRLVTPPSDPNAMPVMQLVREGSRD